ncbi:MAG: SAM-dependent chlorinase/fluorinase [Chloroflexota bacterium]
MKIVLRPASLCEDSTMSPVVTLTTDFGLSDAYVAATKGVIVRISPQAQVVDTSHDVKPKDIAASSFLFSTVYSFFPPGIIRVEARLVPSDSGVGFRLLNSQQWMRIHDSQEKSFHESSMALDSCERSPVLVR